MKKAIKRFLVIGAIALVLGVGLISRFSLRIDPPFTMNVIEQC